MEITSEQLNFLIMLNRQGALTSDFLGDIINSSNCDTIAEEQCKLLEKEGYILSNGFSYSITDKGNHLVKIEKLKKGDLTDSILEKLIITKKIIEILINNQCEDGLSRISQNDIATQINRSPSCVSKTLRKLEKHDKCIEKIAPAVYKVNHEDIISYGVFPKIFKYYNIIVKHPEVILKPYKEQSEITNMSIEDIKMVRGYIYGAYGKP